MVLLQKKSLSTTLQSIKMMKLPRFSLVLTILAGTLQAKSQPSVDGRTFLQETTPFRVCVLNYEAPRHPFSKIIRQLFGQRANIRLVNGAKPIDFVRCIKDDFNEILFIAHTVEIRGDPKLRLGYYSTPSSPQGSLLTDQTPKVATFLRQVFIQARDWLRLRKESNVPVQLNSIRFLSCNISKTFLMYPELWELISENKIQLDEAPAQELLSSLKKRRVATLDRAWLSESLQPIDASAGNRYFFLLC